MPGQASAATILRHYASHGVANCQPKSRLDRNLLMSSEGILNAGASNSFVTCDFDYTDFNGSGFESIKVSFRNLGGTAVVHCKLTDGSYLYGVDYFTDQTLPMESGGYSYVLWTAEDDNSGVNFVFPIVSCLLPPSMKLLTVESEFQEDIGN